MAVILSQVKAIGLCVLSQYNCREQDTIKITILKNPLRYIKLYRDEVLKYFDTLGELNNNV